MTNDHDLLTRIDERVHGVRDQVNRLAANLAGLKSELEQRRETEAKERKRDRIAFAGICGTLGGVAVAVAALILGAS